MKKVLVTGATGFIGSTLVEKLNQSPETKNWSVRILARESSQLGNLDGLRFERVNADLNNVASLAQAVKDIDFVFHVAGVVSARTKEEFFKCNVEGTENLAEAIKRYRPHLERLIYFSSLAAGGPMTIAKERTESDPDEPVSLYGKSKLESELRLRSYAQHFPITVLRPPLVYGPKDKGVFVFVKTAHSRVIPKIAGDTESGEKYFSVIHSSDLVDLAIKSALHSPTQSMFEVFYAASDGVYSFTEIMGAIKKGLNRKAFFVRTPKAVVKAIAQLATLTSKITQKTYPLTNDKLHEIFADYWICSNTKAKTQLGFEPRMKLEEGFQTTIDWYRKQEWISS